MAVSAEPRLTISLSPLDSTLCSIYWYTSSQEDMLGTKPSVVYQLHGANISNFYQKIFPCLHYGQSLIRCFCEELHWRYVKLTHRLRKSIACALTPITRTHWMRRSLRYKVSLTSFGTPRQPYHFGIDYSGRRMAPHSPTGFSQMLGTDLDVWSFPKQATLWSPRSTW